MATGLAAPLIVTYAGNGSDRLFVADQAGEKPVAIPDAFFKIVAKKGDGDSLDVLAFLYPQNGIAYQSPPSGTHDHTPYLTSVDVIEALTGLDFLTNLPDGQETEIERVVHTKLWD